MENFKSILFSIIIFAVFALAIFWAFSTIESGSTHVNNQNKKELEAKNKELEKQVADLSNKIDDLTSQNESLLSANNTTTDTPVATDNTQTPTTKTPTTSTTPTTTTTKTNTTTYKYQSLIDSLQKMVNDKIYMKKGSQGTRVGVVQNFLNIYNKTSNKIDNDYGATTVSLVAKFQKDQGLTADGGTGPSTLSKMISWLKKQ